jgi:alpha-tubulin suppressor-like RCC1 family protein
MILSPKVLTGILNVKQIFASDNNTAFITNTVNGDFLYVLGNNKYSKLGQSESVVGFRRMTQMLDEFDQPIMNVQKVCFNAEAMFILADNLLYVCGSNENGIFGLPGIDSVDRPRIHDGFLNQDVTDIALGLKVSYIVAGKICYSAGTRRLDAFEFLGNKSIPKALYKSTASITEVNKFQPLPLFTNLFVNTVESTQVRAGSHTAGLIII